MKVGRGLDEVERPHPHPAGIESDLGNQTAGIVHLHATESELNLECQTAAAVHSSGVGPPNNGHARDAVVSAGVVDSKLQPQNVSIFSAITTWSSFLPGGSSSAPVNDKEFMAREAQANISEDETSGSRDY